MEELKEKLESTSKSQIKSKLEASLKALPEIKTVLFFLLFDSVEAFELP